MADWNHDMAQAPKDGRVIIVAADEVGEFPMAWQADATNALFAPGQIGMWVAADQSFTWRADDPDIGPTRWRHL